MTSKPVKILAIILSLSLSVPVWCQGQNTIVFDPEPVFASEKRIYSGTVYNMANNNPVGEAEISVKNYGIVGYTRSDGYFRVEAPVNISSLDFSKEGYSCARYIYITEKDRSVSAEIGLFPLLLTEAEETRIYQQYLPYSFNDLTGESLRKKESILKSLSKTEVPAVIRVLMPDNTICCYEHGRISERSCTFGSSGKLAG